jgi:hypothetical protein
LVHRFLHAGDLAEGQRMRHRQRSAQFAADRDQVLDEVVLVRVGELKRQSLTPEHLCPKLVAPDEHGARCDSFWLQR